MRRRKRRLTQAELREMGATPGLMARRIGTDGRARLEQFAPESPKMRRDVARRLDSGNGKPNEGSKTA